jgi:uncharacterized protein RhaS with RHS repeats
VLGSGSAHTIYDYQDPNGTPAPPDPFCGTSACDGPEDFNTVNVTSLLRRIIRKGNTATDLTGTTNGVTYVTTNTWENGRLVQIDGPRTSVSDLTAFVYWDNTAALDNRGRLRYLRRHKDAINYLQTTYDLYQPFGTPGSVVDENGRTWQFSEDSRGLLDGTTSPLGNATDFVRDSALRMDYVLLPKGVAAHHDPRISGPAGTTAA